MTTIKKSQEIRLLALSEMVLFSVFPRMNIQNRPKYLKMIKQNRPKCLSHDGGYVVLGFAFFEGDGAAFDFFAVYDEFFDAFLDFVRVFYFDVVGGSAVFACDAEAAEVCGYAGVDGESFVVGLDAEDVL